MFNKTTGPNFAHYGSIIKNASNIPQCYSSIVTSTISDRVINYLYYSTDEIIVYASNGSGMLIVNDNLDNEVKEFAMHRVCKLRSGIFFNIIPMTKNCDVTICYKKNTILKKFTLNTEIRASHIISSFKIDEIYSYYYNVKGPGYIFEGEQHNSFELVYVDNGSLLNGVNDEIFQLNEYEIMIIGPNQFHHQKVIDKPTSYLTILFNMEISDYNNLLNRKFKIDRSTLDIINRFVAVSETKDQYSKDLMISYLKILIIDLFRQDNESEVVKPTSPINQKFENEMLNEILYYINENIYEALYLEDICEHYSLSRSSLQNLFKDNLNIAPKQYINKIKLQKSKMLIKESKYTISMIASMLGFNSVHYFSRKFSQYYKIPPSDFAKSIYKEKLEDYEDTTIKDNQ